MALTDKLTAIANAIRAKTGGISAITLEEMPSEIASIPSGGITPSGSISITENGTYDVEEYAEAVVNVSGGEKQIPDLSAAPIPEGYGFVLYAAIDLKTDAPKSSSLYFSSGSITVETGTLSEGVWTSLTTEQKSATFTLDWSDKTGDYVIYRFMGDELVSQYSKAFDTWNTVVACKFYAAHNNRGTADGFKHFCEVPTVREIYMSGYWFLTASTSIPMIVEKIDGENCENYAVSMQMFYNVYYNRQRLKELKFPRVQHSVGYPRLNGWMNCCVLEELDLSMFDSTGATTMSNAWDGCYRLHTLDISGWDLSAVTTGASSMFNNCFALENLICNGTKLPNQALSFARCYMLTDASLIGIANAIPVSNKTLTLHATPKGRLSTIMGTVADGVFTADESGTVTLENFITQTKGWTVA